MPCEDCLGNFCSINLDTGEIMCWRLKRKNGYISTFKNFEEMNRHAKKFCKEPEAQNNINKTNR